MGLALEEGVKWLRKIIPQSQLKKNHDEKTLPAS